MSTGKCHRGVTWSCDSWWNPAILLNLSMLCWSIYNSCLKSLVSSKINFFVIVQRGISKTSLKALDVVLLSTSDSLKLYQFTTQVAPPFSEQYLQEGFWQLTEYLVADKEILCKTPTWVHYSVHSLTKCYFSFFINDIFSAQCPVLVQPAYYYTPHSVLHCVEVSKVVYLCMNNT